MKQKKKRIVSIIICFMLPVFLFIPVFFTLLEKPFTIFPFSQQYKTGSTDDSKQGGASEVHTLSYTDVLLFEYTLREGAKNPLAGF